MLDSAPSPSATVDAAGRDEGDHVRLGQAVVGEHSPECRYEGGIGGREDRVLIVRRVQGADEAGFDYGGLQDVECAVRRSHDADNGCRPRLGTGRGKGGRCDRCDGDCCDEHSFDKSSHC
jgi:hypothetical protein